MRYPSNAPAGVDVRAAPLAVLVNRAGHREAMAVPAGEPRGSPSRPRDDPHSDRRRGGGVVLCMALFTNQTHRPAGWYPDPQLAGGYRWWSGSEWTTLVVDRPPNVAS